MDLVRSGVAYPLEYLLASDIRQPAVQLLDLGDDTVNLGLVLALDLTRLADGQVHRQLDTAAGDACAGEPASHADGRRPRRGEAQAMQARIGGREGEFRGSVRRG